jgi:hypothetical protein
MCSRGGAAVAGSQVGQSPSSRGERAAGCGGWDNYSSRSAFSFHSFLTANGYVRAILDGLSGLPQPPLHPPSEIVLCSVLPTTAAG